MVRRNFMTGDRVSASRRSTLRRARGPRNSLTIGPEQAARWPGCRGWPPTALARDRPRGFRRPAADSGGNLSQAEPANGLDARDGDLACAICGWQPSAALAHVSIHSRRMMRPAAWCRITPGRLDRRQNTGRPRPSPSGAEASLSVVLVVHAVLEERGSACRGPRDGPEARRGVVSVSNRFDAEEARRPPARALEPPSTTPGRTTVSPRWPIGCEAVPLDRVEMGAAAADQGFHQLAGRLKGFAPTYPDDTAGPHHHECHEDV